MAKIKGISIILKSRQEVDLDPFGKAIYNEQDIVVDNVLIVPSSSDDVINQVSLTGKKVEYVLAIPKGDKNNWVDKEVVFFNQRWKTVGIPLEGIEHLVPLEWNKKVMVERYE